MTAVREGERRKTFVRSEPTAAASVGNPDCGWRRRGRRLRRAGTGMDEAVAAAPMGGTEAGTEREIVVQ